MSQEDIHAQIRSLYPARENHDFELYTDGAGWQDTYGAAAAYIVSGKHKIQDCRVTSYAGISTNRAEFEALLSGLQGILENMKWDTPKAIKNLKCLPRRPSVYWVSDRESLVLSVYKQPNGEPVYRRSSAPDLWCRFEFYERLFHITPIFIPRNSDIKQALCDRLAGEARVLMKEYIDILTLNGNLNT